MVFAVCLGSFSMYTLTNFGSNTLTLEDNRPAAECPTRIWKFATFASEFEKYFNDRFAFRERLIAFRKLVKLKIFKVSASPDVMVGKDGFFFCSAKGGHLGVLCGEPLFNSSELVQWKNLLERRATWCKAHGIDYVFMLAPDKSSIYPEYLPSHYVKSGGPTRADQLIGFLQKIRSPLRFVDLRAAVKDGKGAFPLYLKTDTHWNQLGAYYGYSAIINDLRSRHPEIQPPAALSNFNIPPYIFTEGDLARLQGLLGILTEENIAVNRCRRPPWSTLMYPKWFHNKFGVDDTTPFYCELKDSKLPKALMFRDSFACPLAELFLPEHFSKIAFYWQPEFSEEIVLKEKPSIVMQEALETCLYETIPPA